MKRRTFLQVSSASLASIVLPSLVIYGQTPREFEKRDGYRLHEDDLSDSFHGLVDDGVITMSMTYFTDNGDKRDIRQLIMPRDKYIIFPTIAAGSTITQIGTAPSFQGCTKTKEGIVLPLKKPIVLTENRSMILKSKKGRLIKLSVT